MCIRDRNYRELAFAVLSRFATDIPAADLKAIIDKTYTAAVYCNVRAGENPEDITPLHTLEPDLHLLCLSNGPTIAFKDMAMQLLGNLFEYVLAKACLLYTSGYTVRVYRHWNHVTVYRIFFLGGRFPPALPPLLLSH